VISESGRTIASRTARQLATRCPRSCNRRCRPPPVISSSGPAARTPILFHSLCSDLALALFPSALRSRARVPAHPRNLSAPVVPDHPHVFATLREGGQESGVEDGGNGSAPQTRTTKRERGHAHRSLLLATLLTPAASNDDSPVAIELGKSKARRREVQRSSERRPRGPRLSCAGRVACARRGPEARRPRGPCGRRRAEGAWRPAASRNMRAKSSTASACWALERRVSRGRPSRNSSSRTTSF
jgi:hypothetical protein